VNKVKFEIKTKTGTLTIKLFEKNKCNMCGIKNKPNKQYCIQYDENKCDICGVEVEHNEQYCKQCIICKTCGKVIQPARHVKYFNGDCVTCYLKKMTEKYKKG
jgi:hypothetical protein